MQNVLTVNERSQALPSLAALKNPDNLDSAVRSVVGILIRKPLGVVVIVADFFGFVYDIR